MKENKKAKKMTRFEKKTHICIARFIYFAMKKFLNPTLFCTNIES